MLRVCIVTLWEWFKDTFSWMTEEPQIVKYTDRFSDLEILARTCWGEARNQGEQGMQAVANVIINRANDPKWWGNDIRSVCLKPWQFSCWNAGDPNREKMLAVTPADAEYRVAEALAQRAISGALPDITHGATSYYAKSMPIPPMWARDKVPVAEIGSHLFYKGVCILGKPTTKYGILEQIVNLA